VASSTNAPISEYISGLGGGIGIEGSARVYPKNRIAACSFVSMATGLVPVFWYRGGGSDSRRTSPSARASNAGLPDRHRSQQNFREPVPREIRARSARLSGGLRDRRRSGKIAGVNLAVAATTFAVVFPAELPDKTALASLMLGSRYRPTYVFTGVAAAFAVHVVLALVAGSLLGLLPHRVLAAIVAVLFGVGAVLLFRGRGEEEEEVERATAETPPTFLRVAAVSFGLILVAEFGDLTQIVLINLAARFHDPLAVGTGGLLALWAVAGLAIVGGRGLLRIMPVRLITLIGAAVMAVLAVISLISVIRG